MNRAELARAVADIRAAPTLENAIDLTVLLLRYPPEKFVTITRAADMAGVSRRTIYNWIAAKRVQVATSPGGRPRILAESLRPTTEGRQP